jgi:putative addiction module component (TIGR02574 family)
MSHLATQQLTAEALTLPEKERTLLARALLQSLETSADTGVDEAWDAEISRRVETIRQGNVKGRSADDVFKDIRARHEK